MRDRTERVCANSWEVEALPVKDKQIAMSLSPGAIHAVDREQFKEEPPVIRTHNDPPLNVKILINFAPQNARSATLQPLDTNALVFDTKKHLARAEGRTFTLVAFNLHEQRVIYRQDNSDKIDFPALGEALDSLSLGTID